MALSTRSSSRPAVGATRARQGTLGRNVLWVLLIALVLVILGFLATYAWHAESLSSVQHNARASKSAAQTFNAPQPAAASRQNYQQGGALAPRNNGNPGAPDRSKTSEP